MRKLKFGIPKGSLQDATLKLFERAGISIFCGSRSYYPNCSDTSLSLMLTRAQDMSRFVEKGVLDAGITGRDWVMENEAEVEEIAELNYAKSTRNKVRWVLAVPEKSEISNAKDLKGKKIATELVSVTKRWFREKGVKARVEFSWGATEAKCPWLVDAIVEVTETGRSLKKNGLKPIDVVMESNTVLIANKESIQERWKRNKIESINIALQSELGALEGNI